MATPVLARPDAEDAFAQLRRTDMRARLIEAGVPLIGTLAERAAAEGRELTEREALIPGRDVLSDLAYEIEEYLRSLSVPQLVCLTYGHRWPELVPGRGVPKGFRAVPSPERRGVYLVREQCIRKTVRSETSSALTTCGTIRNSLTLPGEVRGLFDRGHGRSYDYDNDEWAVRPVGSRLSRIDFWNEIVRRMGRDLFPEEMDEAAS